MLRSLSLPAFALALVALAGNVALADPQKPTFDDDVLPILKQHCTNCHGNDKQKSDLNLATYAAMKNGGAGGVVVVPGDPGKSRLYTLTTQAMEPKMPPSGNKVPDAQLNVLKLWIEQGARENAGSKAVAPKPTADIGLKSVTKGRPEGAPPMPSAGKLKLDPVVTARRPGAVLAMAASPWAPIVAVGGQRQVILYNTDSGAYLGVLPFDHGQINSLRFSRNGKFLLVAGGHGGQSGKAVLFTLETGAKVIEVGIESDAILSADISADQTQIAVGSPSKLVRIYSTTNGSVLREIKKHTDWVTAVEFSPDGVLLASGDRNGGLFVWEAFTGREFFSLRGHTAMITDVSWRDDSNVLASSSEDASIRLWEMENGNPIKNWAAHPGGAASVRFSHDGKLASTGRDRITKVWDQNGTLVKPFEALPDLGLKVAITHENAKVIGGDWSGAVRMWNAADAKMLASFDTNPKPLAEWIKDREAVVGSATAKVQAAQKAFDDASARAKAAADAFTVARDRSVKVSADLAANQKLAADQTAVANAAKPQVDAAKAEVDKLTAAANAATAKVTQLEAKVAAETLEKKRADDLAAKAPNDAALAAAAKKANEAVVATTKELEAAKKASTDAAAALKAATDKHAAANAAYTTAMAKAAEANKQVAALGPMVKPALDAIAPAKAASEAANAAVAPTKAALDAANAELAQAKAALEQLRPTAPPEKK